jgi:hypothetical protein
MSHNPFEAPAPAEKKVEETFVYEHDGSGRTYVRQVSVVSALMIAQGILMFLFAVGCIGYSIVVANLGKIMPLEEQANFEASFPESTQVMMTSIFGFWGVISIPLAILNLIAGVLNLGLRARGFGIATLLIGLATTLTVYCAPTGIPLSVYGLIIYFNPAVGEAFRMRKQGMSKQEVLATFVR